MVRESWVDAISGTLCDLNEVQRGQQRIRSFCELGTSGGRPPVVFCPTCPSDQDSFSPVSSWMGERMKKNGSPPPAALAKAACEFPVTGTHWGTSVPETDYTWKVCHFC